MDHSLGLNPSELVNDASPDAAVWHYLTVNCRDIEELAGYFSRLHLLSPASNCRWTEYWSVLADGRYRFHSLQLDPKEPRLNSWRIPDRFRRRCTHMTIG